MYVKPDMSPEDAKAHLGQYGVTYSRAKARHVINGAAHSTGSNGEYHIFVRYRVADWGKPPKSFKNPDALWDFVRSVDSTDIEVSCQLVYPKDGWQSFIEMPFTLTEESQFPLTHVESTKFSRREDGEVQFTITVSQSDSGDTVHVVEFEKHLRVSDDLVSNLLNECRQLSSLFVGKGSNG